MKILEDRLYSKDHEWVLVSGSTARVGITDYAQDALGDVVFVQLPNVGEKFSWLELGFLIAPCKTAECQFLLSQRVLSWLVK